MGERVKGNNLKMMKRVTVMEGGTEERLSGSGNMTLERENNTGRIQLSTAVCVIFHWGPSRPVKYPWEETRSGGQFGHV